MYQEEQDVLLIEDMREIYEGDMEEPGTLDSGEKGVAVLGGREVATGGDTGRG